MARPEERGLEVGVRAVEGGVVPVEAAAGLGRGDEERHDDAAVQRTILVRAAGSGSGSRVRAREDRRGRLARELLQGDRRVLPARKPRRARLDEPAHERPVLVERRPAAAAVLLEREGDVGTALHLLREPAKRAEAEAAEGVVEARRAERHARHYGAGGPSPPRDGLWQPGHQ